MKDVDGFVFEFAERLIEIGAEQGRERFVVGAIVFRHLGESRLIVTAGVLIAAPGINAKTAGAGFVLESGLAEGEINIAAIDAELDEEGRSQHRHEVVGEMKVRRPGAHAVNSRLEMARWQIELNHDLEMFSGLRTGRQ